MSLLSELKAMQRRRQPKRLTAKQSQKRVAKLRAQGYTVRRVRLPNGDVVVLKSKKKKRRR